MKQSMLLVNSGYLSVPVAREIDELRNLRNAIIHGNQEVHKLLEANAVDRVIAVNKKLTSLIKKYEG